MHGMILISPSEVGLLLVGLSRAQMSRRRTIFQGVILILDEYLVVPVVLGRLPRLRLNTCMLSLDSRSILFMSLCPVLYLAT